MKRKFILRPVIFVLALLSTSLLHAQSVAINTDGTTAHGSAILDIKSSTKGMLTPRMNSAQRIAIATPAAGLFVYDTDTNSYWYFNGTAWGNLAASATPGWLLTGNSGTNPVNNFIGTTDAQPLRFRVNNLWAGEINPINANVFLGLHTGESNTTGALNFGFGFSALRSNNSGGYNTAIGSSALFGNTTGSENIAIGGNALYYNTGGSKNIAIGSNSGTHFSNTNTNNTIGIGNDDLLNGSSNQVLIGNQSMVSIGGHVNWGVYSDARIKNTIEEDVKGLDFILKLRPVTYHISSKAIRAITGNKETPEFPGKHDAEKIKHSGFLAQEVEQAAKSAGYDFSGYTVPKNQNELYTIRYAEFVVPLVKAVQELQAMIKTQQQQIDLLMKRIEVLEKK